ncbi:MAG: cell division protein ZapA [Clostridiales bacterium]|nr:cell division protein ZapA [Clostridiales bacterium]
MAQNDMTEVVIGGKVLAMGGSGDEIHIQRVAACVNNMIRRMEDTEGYQTLAPDLKPVLIELNLADELIQAQDRINQLESDIQSAESELSKVKQSLVEAQLKQERSDPKKKR